MKLSVFLSKNVISVNEICASDLFIVYYKTLKLYNQSYIQDLDHKRFQQVSKYIII